MSVLVACAVATWAMVGLIWTVQLEQLDQDCGVDIEGTGAGGRSHRVRYDNRFEEHFAARVLRRRRG